FLAASAVSRWDRCHWPAVTLPGKGPCRASLVATLPVPCTSAIPRSYVCDALPAAKAGAAHRGIADDLLLTDRPSAGPDHFLIGRKKITTIPGIADRKLTRKKY